MDCATHHFGLGLWVRNKVRERFDWDDITLDQEWGGLIEEAACWYVAGGGLEGLFPHDLVHEVLVTDLRWHNPDWYADLHRRARIY
jgi:hypothetical protein